VVDCGPEAGREDTFEDLGRLDRAFQNQLQFRSRPLLLDYKVSAPLSLQRVQLTGEVSAEMIVALDTFRGNSGRLGRGDWSGRITVQADRRGPWLNSQRPAADGKQRPEPFTGV